MSKYHDESPWIYNGNIFDSDQIDDNCGFVYIITNNISGRKYIGKKLFHQNRKIKGKRVKKESDWKKYFGSNDILKEHVSVLGNQNFTRTILRLCKTKSECSYYEAKYQFQYDVLLDETFYNGWIMCRITKKHMSNSAQ